jgi:hypothetical protein
MLRSWCRVFAGRALCLIKMSSGYAELASGSIYGAYVIQGYSQVTRASSGMYARQLAQTASILV